jgi:thioredoxin-like negative regulator of GroEL
MKKLLLIWSMTMSANELIDITTKEDFKWWTKRSRPALVIVTAPWCMQCKQLKEWIGKQNFKGVLFLVMDSKLARACKAGSIKSLPTIIGYKNRTRLFAGPVVDTQVIKDAVVQALTAGNNNENIS